MKQYIKTNDGLKQVAKPKIRVYDSISDLEADLEDEDTTLQEGDIVTTEFVEGAEDVESAVEIVNDTVAQLKEQIAELPTTETIEAIQAQVTQNSADISDLDSRVTAIEGKIPAAATSSNKLVAQSQLPVYTFDASTQTLTVTLAD